MSIGATSEHLELGRAARRFLREHCPREAVRAALEAKGEELPPCWAKLAGEGWLGIHLPEEAGGQGFGLTELGVLLEEAGRAMLPGPFFSTALVGALLASAPGAPESLLASIATGSLPAAVYLGTGALHGVVRQDGAIEVSGELSPVLGGHLAGVLLAPVMLTDGAPGSGGRADGGSRKERRWCLLALVHEDVPLGAGSRRLVDGVEEAGTIRVVPLESLDLTRRLSRIEANGTIVEGSLQLGALSDALVRKVALALAAAECSGIASWCLDAASAYAKERRQFGRPIGQFQAVKHRLADMLVSAEQTAAVAWDALVALDAEPESAASQLSTLIAASVALDAAVENAKGCIQILGGMGFTWEHDAHLYLRRALSLRQLLGGSTAMRLEVARLATSGVRRRLSVDLPDACRQDVERLRGEIRPLVEEVAGLEPSERRQRLVAHGLVCPNWPRPWGRDAGPLEQYVIDEELGRAGIDRPHLTVGAWVLPTLLVHGTPEQQRRFVGPTLLGEITWCQLFSEPNAGSDLASLTTRAVRAPGGWEITGQKVWTSLADQADFGICLARTDPSAERHRGITYFIVDMHSPGIEVRPLRELTGDAMFNEVFLDGAFVPDGHVVGPLNGGWEVARTTLANERVSVSSGSTFGFGAEALIGLTVERASGHDDASGAVMERVGGLLAEAQSLAVMSHRAGSKALAGLDPGSESSVLKLLGAEHEQRVQEMALALLGDEGTVFEGEGRRFGYGFLVTRCLTIAGGTSEVQRNLIGERILGLPRDLDVERRSA